MDANTLGPHISRRFNEDLEKLRSHVLQMGGLVEKQMSDAVVALVEGNGALADEVTHNDHKVNALEVAIDEECSRILATRAPAASDLRLIVAIIKTITDLERIGDEAEKVGFIATRLALMERPTDRYRELKNLGRLVHQMLHSALDAFARLDADAALSIVSDDRIIDDEYEAIQRQVITFMMEDPRTISRSLEVLWVSRALERIGDHAKNICEYVVYMVHGKDIRHTSIDDASRRIHGPEGAR
jgi:phosphate transport system protein